MLKISKFERYVNFEFYKPEAATESKEARLRDM